ncbi:NADPH-dependent ferric siderophore reductase [Saccharopolyspora lacisalsi]|uniref:NADPH-dependent ferric siderophore reductase n=1 Tax=Halosaccharopolyspora lacisalsi TaxID=1000566 RepID=A0A839DSY1_9PSEU|nr:siderophore-interacting protein [Halosaccharopolyspora lacisalsi]MBA8824614.1 NADPH-dependent ferric siderophore reductase [Halosaccharopolyspora lacisalsi]
MRRLSPHLVRITFGGPELAGMASGGLDQRIKVLLPLAEQEAPCLPEEDRTFRGVRELPEERRPLARTYTIRAHRPARAEFDVDFVLHGATGPASAFAERARPGDQVGIVGPNAEYDHAERFSGVEYRMDLLGGHALIVGDETALPAIGSILETLPAGTRATTFVELPEAADIPSLDVAADVRFRWLPRGEFAAARGDSVLEEIRSQAWFDAGLYAWVCGEASMVKAVRRQLLDSGLDAARVTFMGYWREGGAEGEPAGQG